MKIAVTSGKGGTGKTTVSTGLFHVLSKHLKYNVRLLDCDAEEPDCQIFLKAPETKVYPVNISIPHIDRDKCTFCGECKNICAFNAIIMIPSSKFIEVVEDMCHGCGACSYVCNDGAIVEKNMEIGSVSYHDYYTKNDFVEGRMHVGRALQTRVIRETINHTGQNNVILFDSPPGTSCPVVTVVSQADFVIMVTEPTPFGLHDLKLMTETVKQIGKNHGIVINKAGLDFPPLYDYILQERICLLGEIPFKKEYAKAYSEGKVLTEIDNALSNTFVGIINKILNGETI